MLLQKQGEASVLRIGAFFFIRTFEKSEPFHLEYSSTVYLSRKRFGFIITV